jgi:hypothetical protein
MYYGLIINYNMNYKKEFIDFPLKTGFTYFNNGFSENICLKEIDFSKKDIHSSNQYEYFKKRIDFIMRYMPKNNCSSSKTHHLNLDFLEDKNKTNDCKNRIHLLFNYDDFEVDNPKIKTTFIRFIHIDNFYIDNNCYTEKGSQSKIISSSQKEVDNSKVIDYKLRKDICKMPPVHVCVIGAFNKHTKKYSLYFDLNEGNHRITALKLEKYNGYVPTLFIDELSYLNTLENYSVNLEFNNNRIFKNTEDTSNTPPVYKRKK